MFTLCSDNKGASRFLTKLYLPLFVSLLYVLFKVSSGVSLQSCVSSATSLWWQAVVIITLATVSMPDVYTATPVVSNRPLLAFSVVYNKNKVRVLVCNLSPNQWANQVSLYWFDVMHLK